MDNDDSDLNGSNPYIIDKNPRQKVFKVENDQGKRKNKETNKSTTELTLGDERKGKKGHVQMSSFLRAITTCREHS